MKLRTIITQDAEVDDQNSLRHFLFYANEVELQGIVQTSSKFHWQGVPGTTKTAVVLDGEFGGDDHDYEPFDKPYRWPGTEWMQQVIDDYAKDYPNLAKHAAGYPTPDYLRSITKVGNIGYKGETDAPTEGSELIRKAILDDDPRTLYIQVWGGCNTIARALMDIRAAYENTPEWPALHEKITNKIVFTACGEQDETYRTEIAEYWPDILFVKTLQMNSYAYPWCVMPEGESKDCLRAAFMKKEIMNGKSALADGYCTWLDGVEYIGQGPADQFGSNPNILNEWFGAHLGINDYHRYDFLSEGDSPTFFALLDWGFRTLEDFSYGGIAGRYHKVPGEFNSKGQPLNIWDVSMDYYTDRNGNRTEQESMWPHVADLQRDFAARVAWAAESDIENTEYAPSLSIKEGLDHTVSAGDSLTLTAVSDAPVTFSVYEEISAKGLSLSDGSADSADSVGTESIVCAAVPADATAGAVFHIIAKAQHPDRHRLTRYAQVILTVR